MTFKATLLIGAFGLALSAGSASAQTYYNDTSYGPPDSESVIVIAPYQDQARNPHMGLKDPSAMSLSQDVPYDDLDLRTNEGAHELKVRVADAARDVCTQLRDEFPVPTDHNCYRDAVQFGMAKANSAIRNARYDEDDRYDSRY